jgi:hypothetical protein
VKLQDAHTRRVATKTVPSSSGAPMPVFETSKVLLVAEFEFQSSAFYEAQFYLQITHLYVNLQLTFVSSVKNLILGVCGGKWFYSALDVDQQHLQALEAL